MTTWSAASAGERQAALDPPAARQALQWMLPRQFRDERRAELVALCGAVNSEAFSIRFARTQELMQRVLEAVERGRLLVVRDPALNGRSGQDAARAGAADQPAGAVSLARDLIGAEQELPFEGGRYRVSTTPAELRAAVTQNFRPLSRAVTILTIKRMGDKLAASPRERTRWSELLALVSESGGTDRLSLLRFSSPASAPPPRTEAPITPAQLRQALAPEHWFEALLLYEDGTPLDLDCVVKLPNGVESDGPPDGSGTIRVDGLPAAGTCVISLADQDDETVTAADDDEGAADE